MRLLAVLVLVAAQDRRGPLPPDEALKSWRAAPGHRVDLVAAEPLVVDPVALAFDEDGRLYVAEMRDYPSGAPAGQIVLLEDVDGDGRADKSTVFAGQLPLPTSVLPWKGGLFVAVAYEILYLKDTDGDGKADERRAVYAGFGRQNSQHLLNGLQYGIDNRIYGSAGLSGGRVGGVSIQGSDFRFDPATGAFEAVSGSSQFGNAFDDWGRRFIVRHDDHLIHPVLSSRYLARQPRLSFPAVQESLSDHGLIPKLHPVSPRDAVFTTDTDSSCSVTFHRGSAFVCEPVLNLVHQDTLVPRGASFTARRAIQGAEFLASTDPWCRPVYLASGPDGALYVADMYRAVIEHPDYIPKEIQRKLHHEGGRDCGRIWRVVSGEAGPRPRMSRASTAELVAELESPIAWRRLTAQRLIVERQARDAAPLLREGARSPLGRLHALYTLAGLGALAPEDVAAALRDPEPGVREHALVLAEGHGAILAAALSLADDPDARVRFQMALSLGECRANEEAVFRALLKIVARDAADPWARAAVLCSIGPHATRLLDLLLQHHRGLLEKPEPGAIELVRSLAEIAAAEDPASWLSTVAGAGPPARWQREALTILPRLRRSGKDVETRGEIEAWTEGAARVASDPSAGVAERVGAVELLALTARPARLAGVEGLLSAKEPPEVQIAAVKALAAWPGEPAAARLLDGWAGRTVLVRREIAGAMLARPERTRLLLDRIEKGEVRAVEVEAAHASQLQRHPDAGLRERARKLLKAQVDVDREEVVREVGGRIAKLRGDRARGEKVFGASCAICHRLAGSGTKVGPDLDGARGRDRRALLADLLDPNRAMDPSYQSYLARTAQGEMVYGVIAAETPAGVTLRRAMGEETTVLRKDLAELKAWPASLMPEGLESSLTSQDFADLLEFLSPVGPR